MRTAILDLGTNTFHLLISEISDGKINVLYKEKIAVKIGQGGIQRGFITESAKQRALEAIASFHNTILKYDLDKVTGKATSAIRSAKNGIDLLNTIKERFSIQIDIIDGEKEAEYIYFGVRQAVDLPKESVLIVDIGGGSVEFIIANNKKVFWKGSFEIGAQRLLDLFHQHDPITQEDIKALDDYLNDKLSELLIQLDIYNPEMLIGSSGTFDTLSDMYVEREQVEKDRNDPALPITLHSFHDSFGELITKDRQERLAIPGMVEMRVDMIVVASCIIHFLLSKHPFLTLKASAYALKEGVLHEIAQQTQF